MYELSDKASAIREIQKYLHVISDSVNPNVPRISIDGIYGVETREAVKIFQELYGLIISGLVDLLTFNKLFFLYNEAIKDMNRRDKILTENGFPITVGTQNNDVAIIHLLIDELQNTYKDIGRVNTKSNYFSNESKNAVLNLQKIFRTSQNGEVDAAFFERMINEIDAIHRLNEEYI